MGYSNQSSFDSNSYNPKPSISSGGNYSSGTSSHNKKGSYYQSGGAMIDGVISNKTIKAAEQSGLYKQGTIDILKQTKDSKELGDCLLHRGVQEKMRKDQKFMKGSYQNYLVNTNVIKNGTGLGGKSNNNTRHMFMDPTNCFDDMNDQM